MNFDIIGMFSFIADLVTLILLLKNYKIVKNKIFAVLFIWAILSVMFDFFAIFSPSKEQQLVSFYSIMLEVLVVAILYFLIVHKKIYKIIIAISLIGFLAFSTVEWNSMGDRGFSTWLASIAVVFTLGLSLLSFIDLFLESKNEFLLERSSIWLIFAYMIYAAGCLFLFATTESIVDIFKEPGFWRIFFIANIIKNLFFIKAVLVESKIIGDKN